MPSWASRRSFTKQVGFAMVTEKKRVKGETLLDIKGLKIDRL